MDDIKFLKKLLLLVLENQLDQQRMTNETSALQAALLLVLTKNVPGFDQELQRAHSGAEALLNADDEPAIRQLQEATAKLRYEI